MSKSFTIAFIDGTGNSNRPCSILLHASNMLLGGLIHHNQEIPDVKRLLVTPKVSMFAWGCTTVPVREMNNQERNRWIIESLPDYIETDFCMLVSTDGYPVNPLAWDPAFLDYDYVGSAWPLNEFCGGSFSLRSQFFLSRSKNLFQTHSPQDNEHESLFLCHRHKDLLIKQGIKFAPKHLASKFSTFKNPETDEDLSFGFNGWSSNRRLKWKL